MRHYFAQIEAFCRVGSGATPSRSQAARYFGGQIPWVKSGELRETIITRTEEMVTEAALAETALRIVPKGAILVAMYGATVGRVGVLGIEATSNQAVCHVIPDPSKADSRYIFHALRGCMSEFIGLAVGGAQPNISQQIIRQTAIFLPELEEQRRIAAILDQADALRTKRQGALARLDEMARAILVEMFGDPARNVKAWPMVTLSQLIADGPQNGLYKPSSAYGDGTRILRIDSFYDGTVTHLADLKRLRISDTERVLYGLRAGDIVVNRVNSMEYLGKSALILELTEPTVFESNMMRLAVDRARVEPLYVVQLLQTSFIKDQIRAAAKHAVNQSSINQQDVMGFRVPCPPIALQQQFARHFERIGGLQAQQETSLARLDSLFASLQHRAFRGEL